MARFCKGGRNVEGNQPAGWFGKSHLPSEDYQPNPRDVECFFGNCRGWPSRADERDIFGRFLITRKTLKLLHDLLTRIADGEGNARALARDAIILVDHLVAEAGQRGRGEAAIAYVVEDSVNGPVLTERRKAGRAHPFRCPKAVYDTMAKVLAASDRAMPLDEIISAVAEVLGDQPPDYQVRVPLRFWMFVSPPLITRMRARYRATAMATFVSTTSKLWSDLRAPGGGRHATGAREE